MLSYHCPLSFVFCVCLVLGRRPATFCNAKDAFWVSRKDQPWTTIDDITFKHAPVEMDDKKHEDKRRHGKDKTEGPGQGRNSIFASDTHEVYLRDSVQDEYNK